MTECIFCKIVKGEIPSYKIYEDEKVLAMLDVNPLTKGHTLIIPKNHSKDIFEMSEDDLTQIIKTSKVISNKLKSNLGCTGINLVQANGKDAHQSVFHFHLHVIPRYEDDGVNLNFHGEYKVDNFEELKNQITK